MKNQSRATSLTRKCNEIYYLWFSSNILMVQFKLCWLLTYYFFTFNKIKTIVSDTRKSTYFTLFQFLFGTPQRRLHKLRSPRLPGVSDTGELIEKFLIPTRLQVNISFKIKEILFETVPNCSISSVSHQGVNLKFENLANIKEKWHCWRARRSSFMSTRIGQKSHDTVSLPAGQECDADKFSTCIKVYKHMSLKIIFDENFK